MRRLLLVASTVLAAALVGCTTHRPDLAETGPPRPIDRAEALASVNAATSQLLEAPRDSLNSLPAEALAPLTSAATESYAATGGVGARRLASRYGNQLMEAQTTRNGVTGFFGAGTDGRPGAEMTALAGEALMDLYRLTRERRYRRAAAEAVEAITSERLRWRRTDEGFGVSRPGRQAANVALTANAALVLRRADQLLDLPVRAEWRGALRTVTEAQAAVGRWYSNVGGEAPMSLGSWARTLHMLLNVDTAEAAGIVGGGIDGMWQAAFTPSGAVRRDALTTEQPVDVAMALRVLAEYGDPKYADLAFPRVLEQLGEDVRASDAGFSDPVAQAHLALAFAERQRQLVELTQ